MLRSNAVAQFQDRSNKASHVRSNKANNLEAAKAAVQNWFGIMKGYRGIANDIETKRHFEGPYPEKIQKRFKPIENPFKYLGIGLDTPIRIVSKDMFYCLQGIDEIGNIEFSVHVAQVNGRNIYVNYCIFTGFSTEDKRQHVISTLNFFKLFNKRKRFEDEINSFVAKKAATLRTKDVNKYVESSRRAVMLAVDAVLSNQDDVGSSDKKQFKRNPSKKEQQDTHKEGGKKALPQPSSTPKKLDPRKQQRPKLEKPSKAQEVIAEKEDVHVKAEQSEEMTTEQPKQEEDIQVEPPKAEQSEEMTTEQPKQEEEEEETEEELYDQLEVQAEQSEEMTTEQQKTREKEEEEARTSGPC